MLRGLLLEYARTVKWESNMEVLIRAGRCRSFRLWIIESVPVTVSSFSLFSLGQKIYADLIPLPCMQGIWLGERWRGIFFLRGRPEKGSVFMPVSMSPALTKRLNSFGLCFGACAWRGTAWSLRLLNMGTFWPASNWGLMAFSMSCFCRWSSFSLWIQGREEQQMLHLVAMWASQNSKSALVFISDGEGLGATDTVLNPGTLGIVLLHRERLPEMGRNYQTILTINTKTTEALRLILKTIYNIFIDSESRGRLF